MMMITIKFWAAGMQEEPEAGRDQAWDSSATAAAATATTTTTNNNNNNNTTTTTTTTTNHHTNDNDDNDNDKMSSLEVGRQSIQIHAQTQYMKYMRPPQAPPRVPEPPPAARRAAAVEQYSI